MSVMVHCIRRLYSGKALLSQKPKCIPLKMVPSFCTLLYFVLFQGVMSGAIPWDVLESQYFSDDVYREEIRKMVTIIDDVKSDVSWYYFLFKRSVWLINLFVVHRTHLKLANTSLRITLEIMKDYQNSHPWMMVLKIKIGEIL